MSKSAGILRRTALVLFALIALAILLMVLSRLTTPSAQTRTALELMRMDELPEGENAFGLLWTLNRDVPDDEIDAVVRADVTKVAGWEENWGPREPIVEEQEWRRDAYPDLSPAPEDRALFCGTDAATPCLEHVQAAAEDVALAVERNAPLLDRIRRLRDTQVIRNAMPPKLMAPMPSFADGALPMTAHALAFVTGNEQEAVAETCQDLAAWRRMATNTDMLIGAMVGIAYAGRGYGELLGEMLAEWPVDRSLPPACGLALSPMTDDDLMLCHPLRGEFRLQEAIFGANAVAWEGDSWWGRLARILFYDRDATIALAAQQLAPYCTADRPGRVDYEWPETRSQVFLRWPCVGNPLGCALTSLTHGGFYGDYADRMLDFDARLRLLRTLVWMRTQAENGARADALIERLPPELQNPNQPAVLSEDGRRLQVALIDNSRGEWAEVPLPPALWPVGPERVDE